MTGCQPIKRKAHKSPFLFLLPPPPLARRRKAKGNHPLLCPAAGLPLKVGAGMEEKARRLVARLAATPDSAVRDLPLVHRAVTLPLLSAASAALRASRLLSRLRPRRALPVPVVSVGNLTWGGNGKTPMVDFLARSFHRLGISPLLLTRVSSCSLSLSRLSLLPRHHFSSKLGCICF
jgi:hypothetical protein